MNLSCGSTLNWRFRRPAAGHARPLQSGVPCRGRRSRRPHGGTRFPGIVGRPAHRSRGGQDPSYNANRKKEIPLGRGRHICRPYKAAESPHSLILLSLRLLNQISKRFSLNFCKIFCFRIVKRRHWYGMMQTRTKTFPQGACVPCWERLFVYPARAAKCATPSAV